MLPTQENPLPATTRIDPRGPRFAATLTTVLLAAVLLTAPSGTATTLLAVQTVLFGIGAAAGIQHTPYAWLFKTVVRPRLAPPTEIEDAGPPRFAQAVGLGFAVVAVVGFLSGATTVGVVATGFALAAAFLNAAFGFCLGCELYLLVRRAFPDSARPTAPRTTTTARTATTEDTSAGPIPVATKG
ncbi:DUF4395 domain-containing protein [Nocardioides sp. WL0053]|uniref:DUF4395 domain-containing protein n=1 Tax=Nocardioides jiangsuensis TaxID=2866161 RepID=A0ABS7RIT1_9ACTN|nr:DUF4395 domain-containing protein [Nocardioides jiangsuensis]